MDLNYPFSGRWLVQNSPADRVPSHGTSEFASSHAVDFVPVGDTGRTAPFTLRSLFASESADRFPGFGRPVLAPVAGTVLAAHDGEPDHAAYRGIPSVSYALTQRRRVAEGWRTVAGNHLFIAVSDAVVVLCHLRCGSITVRPGDRVDAGQHIADCGNSGNSTEPHLHIQVTDSADIAQAHAVPVTFGGSLPRNGDIIDVDAVG